VLQVACGQLEDEPAAEAVSDPVGRPSGCLDDVLDVLGDRPGVLPAGAAVAAQVEGADAMTGGEAFLRQPAEAEAVGADSV
jgi:hypothetical protein